MPKDFVGLAPMSVLCARLCSALNPGIDDMDSPLGGGGGGEGGAWPPGISNRIRLLFREFVSELLQVRFSCAYFRDGKWGGG